MVLTKNPRNDDNPSHGGALLSRPLAMGKLPNEFLRQFLEELQIGSGELLVAPGVGEDIAAVQLEGEEILVLKSDPVTFATDAIGHYAVIVNVNDIATSGATPRWLLASLLFPPGSTAARIRAVMADLQEVSRRHGLVLCGGHTEITDAVTRPVVVCQVAGTVSRNRLIRKQGMKEGDCVVLTKGIAIEGTCILARELPDRLMDLGMSAVEIERCRELLAHPGISVLKEAEIAGRSGSATAMHDITEGGLSTALEELSAAGGHRIRVELDRVPVLEETARVCRLLEIDPLGLIGSGSLLICCEPEACYPLVRSIKEAGILATCIGQVLDEGTGIEAIGGEQRSLVEWKRFEVDEIARVFERRRDSHQNSPTPVGFA